MGRIASLKKSIKPSRPSYILDEQIGFILRQVWQRHAAIFAEQIGANLTPTQWAALAKLTETGPCSQNQLGRLTAAGYLTDGNSVTQRARDLFARVRAATHEITERLWGDLPAEDLATTGRVLGIITERANAELARG